MPSVFLSPSTQEYNLFVNGGTEEYYANLITDAMIPYLRASGITFSRNNPYYRDSAAGKNAAEITANNLKQIYPDPSLVTAVPTTTLAELRRTKTPAVLVEVAYHDNVDDANWIKNNINAIGRNFALSVADILGVPVVEA